MPRMNILNTVEREAFNSPPVFSSFQRKQYFDFPSKLRRFAAGLRNPAYQLGFLLSAGYFKAARRFFSPGSFHPRDIEYVARQLEPGAPTVDFAQYHPRARQRHQHTIRTFYGFRACDSAASRLLLKEIAGLVRSQVKPKVIFWRCIDVLVREKIEVPSYTRLAKLILGAINRRSQELAAIIERSLTQEVRALLEDLLRQEPLVGDTVPGKTSAYKLTLMKKLSQSTKPSKVKERVVDLSLVRGLYDQLSPTLQSLALMPGGIRYYAESVLRSEIFQLTRRDDPDRYLHGSGATFKKGRRADPGALGERESLACQIGPKFKLCTRSRASLRLSWPASAIIVRILGNNALNPPSSRAPARRSDVSAGSTRLATSRPSVSTKMWRLRPFTRLCASKPRAPPRSVVLTDWPSMITTDGQAARPA